MRRTVSLFCVVSELSVLKFYMSIRYFSKTKLWCYKVEGLKTQNSSKQASNSNNPISGAQCSNISLCLGKLSLLPCCSFSVTFIIYGYWARTVFCPNYALLYTHQTCLRKCVTFIYCRFDITLHFSFLSWANFNALNTKVHISVQCFNRKDHQSPACTVY